MKTVMMTLVSMMIAGSAFANNLRCQDKIFFTYFSTADEARAACQAKWPTCLANDGIVYDLYYDQYRLVCDQGAND